MICLYVVILKIYSTAFFCGFPKYLGHLYGDVPRPDDHHLGGPIRQLEEPVTRDPKLCS